jgi:hypothetical protein
MLGNARFVLVTGALFLGIAASGCSAAPGAAHLVHATAKVEGAPSATPKTASLRAMDDPQDSSVQIVELNGTYEGCLEMSGAWSVAVNGSDVVLDNPPLEVVQADFNCQLLLTSVRADQLYFPTSPLQISDWMGQSSAFSPQASEDGGAPQVAFYASAGNMDPGYFNDFQLLLFYSSAPNETSSGTSATYTTNTSSGAEADQVAAPDYSVDLSQISIQADANGLVTSASGPVSFNYQWTPGSGYVIDDGTLPANPTFGQVDALFTSQTSSPIQWGNFSVDQSAFSLQWNQLPLVRNVVIQNAWGSGLSSYEVVTITFNPPGGETPNFVRKTQVARK